MNYSSRIGKILDLSDTYWEYFDRLPLDVQAATLGALEALKFKASEDNQVALPQNMKVFVVQFWTRDSFEQEYFRCPNEALKRLLEIRETWGVDSDVEIFTITVT